jgi:hypothetical protein
VDSDISRLVFRVEKNRSTCVDWNSDDHDCYPNKCGPTKKIIQGDKGQSNLGSSVEKRNNFILTILPEVDLKSP